MAEASPENREEILVSYRILVDNQELGSEFIIESMIISRDINRVPIAQLRFIDGGVADVERFEAGNSDVLIPGNPIEIKAGYHANDQSVFKGIIVSQSIKIDAKSSKLQVICKHELVKMTIGRKNDIFIDKKDSEVINSKLQAYSIHKEVEATEIVFPQLLQNDVSDWDYTLQRIDVNGMVLIPTLEGVKVKKPVVESNEKYNVTYGDSLISVDLEIDSRRQLSKVKGVSWDAASQERLNAISNPEDSVTLGNLNPNTLADTIGLDEYLLQTPAGLSTEMLDMWTTSRLQKSKIAFARGKIKIKGIADLDPGDTIRLSGLSDRFNGNFYVGGLKHIIRGGEWITEIQAGLSDEWYVQETPRVESPPNGGWAPAIHGLSIGIVKQIDQDPEGNYRVKVILPILDKDTVSVWARLSHLYATQDAGYFFMPELEDEVVLGFVNEDPHYPIILGSLYSKNRGPELNPTSENPEKAIITKNKLKIHFNDEEKILTIITPAENQFVLDDANETITISDQNNNVIELSSNGISLTSDNDISLTAQGNIILEATQAIEHKANTDFKVEGMSVELKGKSTFSAQGQGSAELKSSGQTEVKGSIVMIN